MNAVALTDHGVNFGNMEFYKKAKKAGIKPIIGCELYVADGLRTDRVGTNAAKKTRNYFHLILLAKDYRGYQTLNRLTSRAHTEGYYYKPRIDRELLLQNHEGLVALSACAGGVVSAHLVNENYDAAREAAIWYRELFGQDFYLEVQDHGIPVDRPVLEGMPRLAQELGIPLVATNDCHYIRKEHAIAHNVLLHIRDASKTGAKIDVESELRYGTTNYYFKTADEMAQLLGHFPGAIENTVAIAEKCNLELPHEFFMPNFPIPTESRSETLDEYLREITWQGIERRYPTNVEEEAKSRTEFELEVITRMGYSGYFLIVQDFIQAARDRGVSVGPGRGSAAGSLVAFALGITNVDPLKYDLLFERFLNPDRVSMPDIDIDFADDKRELVIDYVKDKYGHDAVAQIITFGTLSSRAVLKDVGRVLGVPLSTITSITDKITVKFGRVQSISEALENAELRWVKESTEPQIRKLIEYSQVLEGMARNTSLHAAGVVIAPGPLENYIPLYKTPDSGLASQYTMNYLEDAGLLKMDFLGLRTLTIIDRTLELIKQRHNTTIDIDEITLEDPKTYELVGRGLTIAVFQFESVPMQKYLKDLKPTSLEDLTAMNALYRPGPMENIPEFIERKWGRKPITYLHKTLEPILGKTYGICVYQEQIMQIAQQLGGFTLAQADNLRRAMGKKQIKYMEEMKGTYFEGCGANGIDKKTADEIWEMMVKFADYGFNKCAHAQTRVQLPDGRQISLSAAYRMQPTHLMAMWPDGEMRPHAVQKIVKTGVKPLLRVQTASGRVIRATPEHRLLTTKGYLQIAQMTVGTELITAPRITPAMRQARRQSIVAMNQSQAQRKRASDRMKQYQAARPYEEKAAHMRRMHSLHPDLTRNAVAAMHQRLKELWATDPEFRQRHMERSLLSVRACYDSGPGFGRCSIDSNIASNGMWCASQHERDMCEWLLAQGIEFQMHKPLPSGRVCDFYFAGIYWEMDGMDRASAYFADKYGQLPYVVVTPEDFQAIVSHHLELEHVENGDPIVSITPCKPAMTYDVEMAPDGPLNFMANGIVSHNSHSLAYSYLAYQTAWLKANYAPEFLAANMTAEANDLAKVVKLIDECRKFSINVLPPDVNQSMIDFYVVDAGIRFGMAAIRNVGEGAVAAILKEREKSGAFTTIFDFTRRLAGNTLINKRLLESLVVSGAFDSVHPNRRQCFMAIDAAMQYATACANSAASGMASLFADATDDGGDGTLPEPALPTIDDWGKLEKLRREKEVLNFYVSGHPLQEYAAEVEAFSQISLGEVEEDAKFDGPVRACGIVTAIRTKLDKRENRIAFATIEDFTGKAECIFWSDAYRAHGEKIAEGEIVFVVGKAEMNGADGIKIIVDDIIPVAQSRSRFANALAVNVQLDVVPEDAVDRTLDLFKNNQGELQCIFRVYDEQRSLVGRWVSRRYTITPTPNLLEGLRAIYGRENVKFVGAS